MAESNTISNSSRQGDEAELAEPTPANEAQSVAIAEWASSRRRNSRDASASLRLGGRKWSLRLAAIGIGLLPLVGIELFLRIFGLGNPRVPDALSGFNPAVPLFERHANLCLTSPAHQPFFPAQGFLADKPANEFRIFCFGGSTVHGHPYQSETAFPKWLEMELSACDSNHVYRAINCGGVSYASYRLEPLVREALAYQPDLIIVATGENEFLEDRTYSSLKERSAFRKWVECRTYSLRIVNVARNWVFNRTREDGVPRPPNTDDCSEQEIKPRRRNAPLAAVEIRTKLDDRSGYASYHRDDAWHDRVAAQFEESVGSMIAACRKAGVPILLIKLGSNLRDCPPYKSEHRAGLSPQEEQKWQAAFDGATFCAQLNPSAAWDTYSKAERLDADYALLSFRLARDREYFELKEQALKYYIKARDDDICPLRMPTRHEEILNRISKERGVPLVDAAGVIASRSLDQIPGNDWYLDHVHPTISGHQAIAREIVAELTRAGIVGPMAPWTDQQRQKTYTAYLGELPAGYFADGRHRVEWLESWARREKLLEEAAPKVPGEFVRAGFRRLELGDEETGIELVRKGIAGDPRLTDAVKRRANQALLEGRPVLAGKLNTVQQ